MSRLYFAPIDQAFTLGSSQINDVQEEIAQLTKIILDSNVNQPKRPPPKTQLPLQTPLQTPLTQEYIGQPDNQVSKFDDIDYNLMKVLGHPKFDDIVKNYVLINHPTWLQGNKDFVKSTFGNKYQTTICFEVQKYLMFFIISVIVFVILSITL